MGTELRKAIQQLAGTHLTDDTSMALATVLSVNLATRTCSVVLVGGQTTARKDDVMLMPTVADGILLIPSIDSTVVVMWSKRNQPFVAMYSDLQDIYLAADGLVTLNDNTYGGLVRVADLVTKLNAIEGKVNDLLTAYNAHTHTDPVSGSTGTTSAPVVGSLTPTQVTDIENPNVVHG